MHTEPALVFLGCRKQLPSCCCFYNQFDQYPTGTHTPVHSHPSMVTGMAACGACHILCCYPFLGFLEGRGFFGRCFQGWGIECGRVCTDLRAAAFPACEHCSHLELPLGIPGWRRNGMARLERKAQLSVLSLVLVKPPWSGQWHWHWEPGGFGGTEGWAPASLMGLL